MANRKSITVEEIKELDEKLEPDYTDLHNAFDVDEKFYELKFEDLMNIPDDFKFERTPLPTGRDAVEAFVNHVNLKNARVYVNRMSEADVDREVAEMMRKFYLGVLYLTNTTSILSPWRIAAKHYALHGLGILKTIYVADKWPDKPNREEGEKEDKYDARKNEWQEKTFQSIPIVIQAVHPACMKMDTSYDDMQFVIETHKKIRLDVTNRWKNWSNPKNKKLDEEVELKSYWDGIYRCELADGEPLLRTRSGVAKHGYGFIPYVFMDAGLGNVSVENKLAERYVGLLRKRFPLLVSESTNYSMCDILIKHETMGGGYITGADAATIGEIKKGYGVYTPIGDKDVKVNEWERKMPPSEAYNHLATTNNYIMAGIAPSAMRGQSQSGVRSAAHFAQARQEGTASTGVLFSDDAFRYGTQQVLINCARLQKYILPSGMRLWSRTQSDDFSTTNVLIKPEKMREPFVVHVEFSPVNPQDEFQRHVDLNAMWDRGQGIISEEHAWSQMANVNPESMKRQKAKERIRNDPDYQAVWGQYAARKAQEAIMNLVNAENPPVAPPVAPSMGPGMPQGMPPPGQPSRGGHMIPQAGPIPTPARDLQGMIDESRIRPTAPGRQGQGGGGNR